MSQRKAVPGRRAIAAMVVAVVAVPVVVDGADRWFADGSTRRNEIALSACRRVAETCRDALMLARESGTERPVSINGIRADGGALPFRVAAREAESLGAELFTIHPDSILPSDRRVVVAVSPIAYGDVPRPSIWRLYAENPAHAVAYSDGSVDLVHPSRFVEIDLTDFVLMGDWIDPMPSQIAAAGLRASNAQRE